MTIDRRAFITHSTAGLASAALAARGSAQSPQRLRKIATEEAFATPELVAAWLEIARGNPTASLDIPTGINFIFNNPPPGSNPDRFRRQLLDWGPERLSIMDQAGVDMHLLSVTIPGVQMFEPSGADALAVRTNNQLPPPSRSTRRGSRGSPAFHPIR